MRFRRPDYLAAGAIVLLIGVAWVSVGLLLMRPASVLFGFGIILAAHGVGVGFERFVSLPEERGGRKVGAADGGAGKET